MSRQRKFIFHVGGGAAVGGKTLTCGAETLTAAHLEADAYFAADKVGPGAWFENPALLFLDPEGTIYAHYYWVPA